MPAAGAGGTEYFSSDTFATPPPGLFSTSLSISHTFPRCFFAHRLEIEYIMAPPKKKQKASNTARVSLSPNNHRGRPNKNNRRSARDQPQPDSQPVIPVRHPEAYVESTILLSDEIFATACPKEWEGHLFRYCVASYDSATKLFSLKYEKQTILSDGVSFLSDDDGDVEIMENVKLETIQLGANRYSAALARISDYRVKEKGVVVKSLKQDDTYLLPAQVDLRDINETVSKMGSKGWKAVEIMEVGNT